MKGHKIFKKLFDIAAKRTYICPECGDTMRFETDDVLVCDSCYYSTDLEYYEDPSDDDYEILYPTKGELLGIEEDFDYDDEDEDLYDLDD